MTRIRNSQITTTSPILNELPKNNGHSIYFTLFVGVASFGTGILLREYQKELFDMLKTKVPALLDQVNNLLDKWEADMNNLNDKVDDKINKAIPKDVHDNSDAVFSNRRAQHKIDVLEEKIDNLTRNVNELRRESGKPLSLFESLSPSSYGTWKDLIIGYTKSLIPYASGALALLTYYNVIDCQHNTVALAAQILQIGVMVAGNQHTLASALALLKQTKKSTDLSMESSSITPQNQPLVTQEDVQNVSSGFSVEDIAKAGIDWID